jgi:aspartate racemase
MKIIGLIGGTSWVSTLEYYRIINQNINRKLGGAHSAHLILYSVNFDEFIIKHAGNWEKIAKSFTDIAVKLERAGANCLLICANTIHKIADEVQENINIPLIHIADVTAKKIRKDGIKKVGLLGTIYTMEEDFYKKRLKEKFNIETIIPDERERKAIHKIIMDELTYDIIKESSKQKYINVINNLILKGAEGIILGCTEIPLLISENDIDIPMYNTTKIHAEAAVGFSLS